MAKEKMKYNGSLCDYGHTIHEQNKYTCQYCGYNGNKFDAWRQLTVEHIIPQKMYKNNENSNLTTVCHNCNSMTSRMKFEKSASKEDVLKQKKKHVKERLIEYRKFWVNNIHNKKCSILLTAIIVFIICGCTTAYRPYRQYYLSNKQIDTLLSLNVSATDYKMWLDTEPRETWHHRVYYGNTMWREEFDWKKVITAITEWVKFGFNIPQAIIWKEYFTPEVACKWEKFDFSVGSAISWKKGGFSPMDAYAWDKAGFSPIMAHAWIDAGIVTPESVIVWVNAGFDSRQTKIIHKNNFNFINAVKWKDNGFTVENLINWGKVVDEPTLALELIKKGYTAEAYRKYAKYNISEKEITLLEKKGAKGIEDLSALINGNIYNLKGRCFEFTGVRLQEIQKTAGIYSITNEKVCYIDFEGCAAPYIVTLAAVQVIGVYTYMNAKGLVAKVPWLKLIAIKGTVL